MTKQVGLDASGFLLLAEGHLRKARGGLHSSPTTLRETMVFGTLDFVIPAIRNARELLKEEEPALDKPDQV